MKIDLKGYYKSNPWQALLFEFSSCLFVATLPLYLIINTWALGILALSSFLLFLKHKDYTSLKRNGNTILILAFLYLLYVLGLFLSKDVARVLKDTTRVFPLIILPLVMLSHDKKYYNTKRIYNALGTGLFIGILICWFHIIVSIFKRENYKEQAKYFFKWIYTDWNLVAPLDGHPSYFAVFIVLYLSMLYCSEVYKGLRQKPFRLIFITLALLLFLLETSSRIGIISFIVVCAIIVLQQFSFKKALTLTLFIAFAILLTTKFDYLGTKFDKIFGDDIEIKFERYHRWKEILEVFQEKNSLILGVGSGDARMVYRRAYYNGNFDLALEKNYNAHNLYLEILVSNGILGLAVLFLVFGHFIYKAKLRREKFSFFFIIVIFCLSESIFGRSQGVLFFTFFYCFYAMNQKSEINYAKRE